MSLLFVNENSATIGIESNRCVVQYADGMKKMVPIETVEGITIMGYAKLTTEKVQRTVRAFASVCFGTRQYTSL